MAGYATPAWVNDASPAIDDSALLDIGHGIEIAEHPYGVCSTAAATAAKEVTIDYSGTLTLFEGLTVRVKFSNANTAANPTLNVNNTGAVPIMRFGTTAATQKTWNAGLIVTFIYDGTNWLMDSKPETIGALNGGIQISSSEDLNDYTETGYYYWGASYPNHSTEITYCSLFVETAGRNTKQTIVRANYPYVWVRYCYQGTTWSPWVQQVIDMLAADLVLHVNSTSGDDNNDGLTAATAVKTWSGVWAKIPHDTSGRNVVVYVAAGSYSKLTIDTWHSLSIAFGPETGVSTSDITVAGYEMKSTSTLCYVQIANFTFTADVAASGIYGHSMHRFATCVFDGASLNANGIIYTTTCTFRNNANDAIVISYGLLIAYQTKIENTVTGTGIKASSAGIASVNTYNLSNAATTPYACTYSGRIFVGGRTYKENPGRVSLMTSTQGTQIQSALTTINLSENAPQYSLIEISIYPGTTNDGRGIILIDGYALTAASSMYFPLVLNGAAGGVVHITKNGTSTTSFKIQATHPSYSVIRIESVYAINT